MSGTIIDALTVELNLDPKKFSSGAKKAIDDQRAIAAGVEGVNQAEARAGQMQAQRERERTRQVAQKIKDDERAAGQRQHLIEKEGKERANQEQSGDARIARDKERARNLERAKEIKSERAAAREKGKDQAAVARQNKEEWTAAKEAALGFGAAVANVAVAKYFVETASNVADLGRSAHNLAMSTPMLRAWGNAVETIGGNADAAMGSLQGLQKGIVGLRTGDPALIGPLNEIGVMSGHPISLKGTDGQFVVPLELVKRIAEATKSMEPGLRAVELGKLGLDPGTINAMQGGRAAMDTAIAAANTRGVPSDKEAAEDAKLQAETVKLEQSFRRLGEQVTLQFAPRMTQAANNIRSFLDLVTGKIAPAEYLDRVARSSHDAKVQALIDSGVPPARAEGQASAEEYHQAAKSGWDFKDSYTYKGIHKLGEWLGVLDPPSTSTGDVRPRNGGAGFAKDNGASFPADVEAFVRSNAVKLGLNPEHEVARFRAEGGGHSKISPTGNFGPGQLGKATATDLGVATSPYAPNYSWQANADAAQRYFKVLLKMFGNRYDVATVAYHDGPNAASTNLFATTGSQALMGPQSRAYLAAFQAAQAPPMATPSLNRSSHGDSTVETHIHGDINVHTAAKDADGIARGMRKALETHPMVVNAARSTN